MITDISWNKLQLVMFDLDGTLYCQSKLRKIMLLKLLSYYTLRPWKIRELIILYHFRKEREQRKGISGVNLQEAQYVWCADKLQIGLGVVKKVVDRWIFKEPNVYLKSCTYPGVAQFLYELKKKGIKTAIYSDYAVDDKLKEMGLVVDCKVSSTDKSLDSFKPLPNGLLKILSTLDINDKRNCLFIGDRVELDGQCAANAGIPFLLVEEKEANDNFFVKISDEMLKNRI